MNASALLLLSSAFLHASWNAIAKTTKDKEAFLFVAMTVSNLIIAVSLIFFTESFQAGTPISWAIVSGISEGLYFVTLAWALKQTQLGKAYSIMRGGAMIFVWLISTLFMGETATTLQTLGAICVLGGIVVLSFPSLGEKSAEKPGWFYRVPWAWVCAFFIGGYHLSYHQALHHGAEPKSLFAVAMVISWPFLWFAIRGERIQRLKNIVKTEPVKAIAAGIFANMSFVIFLYGLKTSVPGFAISLRNTSIFFAVLFSFFLRESLTRVQLCGALVIGAGAVLLSL